MSERTLIQPANIPAHRDPDYPTLIKTSRGMIGRADNHVKGLQQSRKQGAN